MEDGLGRVVTGKRPVKNGAKPQKRSPFRDGVPGYGELRVLAVTLTFWVKFADSMFATDKHGPLMFVGIR